MIVPDPLREEKKKEIRPEEQRPEDYAAIPQEDSREPQKEVSVAAEPTKKKVTIDDIWATSFPKPTYNIDREREYKRLAKNNTLAKGASLIGDVISLGAGANVNKRNPDNKEMKYTNDMFKYIDDYRNRNERYQLRSALEKRRTAEIERSQNNLNRQFDANEAYRKNTFDANNEWRKGEVDRYKEKADYNAKIDKERRDKAHEYTMAEISERNKAYASHTGTRNKKIKTADGTTYEFTPEDLSLLSSEAYDNIDKIIADYPQLVEKTFDEDTGEVDYKLARGRSRDELLRAYIEIKHRKETPNPTTQEKIDERAKVLGEKKQGDVVAPPPPVTDEQLDSIAKTTGGTADDPLQLFTE